MAPPTAQIGSASRNAIAGSCTAIAATRPTLEPTLASRVSDAAADLEGRADRAAHEGDVLVVPAARSADPRRSELRLRSDQRAARGRRARRALGRGDLCRN